MLFWYLILYSFLGFLLEVVFARAVGDEKKDRKCFLLLPLCPVYGVGAAAILLLPEVVQGNWLLLLPLGAAAATAAEYAMGLFYEKAAGVKFWDYSSLPGNLSGRVCPLFSLFWGVLAVALVRVVHPPVSALAAIIPDFLLLPVLLAVALDGFFTLRLLHRSADTNVLRWYRRDSGALGAGRNIP